MKDKLRLAKWWEKYLEEYIHFYSDICRNKSNEINVYIAEYDAVINTGDDKYYKFLDNTGYDENIMYDCTFTLKDFIKDNKYNFKRIVEYNICDINCVFWVASYNYRIPDHIMKGFIKED
jgi:hypothetical protein